MGSKLVTSTGPGGFIICVFIYMTGTPKDSTESAFMEKPGIEPVKLFVAFPWVETSTWPGGFMICVFYYMMGTPEGSTESGFMEKPGIEPANPGLKCIALIHYTTGASYAFDSVIKQIYTMCILIIILLG